MRLFTEKIKTRFSNCTALQLQSFGLGFLCFVFLFVFRYQSVWHWDDVAYLKNIIRGLPSDLLLGRPGFMYPFIWLWFVIKNFNISFYFVEAVIRIAGIVFLSGAYVFLYRLLVVLRVSARVSFLTVLFLLTELSFSIISSRATDTPLMYLALIASYYFFAQAHEQKSAKRLFVAALLFSYAFLTREPALFHFPFYVIMLFYYYRRGALFSFGKYLTSAALFTAVCISVPLIMLLYYGSYYTETLQYSIAKAYSPDLSDLLSKVQVFYDVQVNLILLPLGLGGVIVLIRQKGLQFFLGVIAAACVPLLFNLFFSGHALMTEPRLFLGYFFIVALGVAFFIDALASLIHGRRFKISAIVTACAVVSFVLVTRFLPQYNADLSRIAHLVNYYESIKPLLGKDTVIIIGDETLYVAYRAHADGKPSYFISPGWSWPTGQLVEIINNVLSKNLTVVYDPRSRTYQQKKREKDLDEMTATFNLMETQNGFVLVTRKK